MTVNRAILFGLFALAVPCSAAADQRPVPPITAQRPRPTARVGVQGFGAFGLSIPVASDTFATSGLETRPMEIGGGAQVTRLWRGVFAQASFTRWDESGERVFIDSRGTKFNLGIPLNIKTTNIDISGGWRFENTRRARRQRVMPYVGGGVGIVKFQESSPFAQSGDDVNEQYTSYHVLGGVEVRLIKWLAVGADVRHRIVPELLGQGGVSSALDETSFNNTSVAGRVLVGF